MASATGMPSSPPRSSGDREAEPLLGRPGDAVQKEDQNILSNLVIGTGSLAQIALGVLFVYLWGAVFFQPLSLFSAHPLLQTFGLLAVFQAILVVQPTHTESQKRKARVWHGSLNLLSFLSFVAGVAIIEYNKGLDPTHHFKSVHGYMGVVTSAVILLQYLAGFTMWLTPALYGGVENAKKLYKYHRMSGYVVLLLLVATVISATKTDAGKGMLHLSFWGVLVCSVLILAGVLPRVQLGKLGYRHPT